MTCRPEGTANGCHDLIQHRGGVELPASGIWTIASGQPIVGERRRSLRTEKLGFRTTHGALIVSTDMTIVTLELGLTALDANAATPLTIGFEGGLRSADRVGRWWFDGRALVDGAAHPFELALHYQGVHARGAAPVAWLTIAEAFLASERGRRGGLRILGDLNAHRPRASHPVEEPEPLSTSTPVAAVSVPAG